MVEKCIKMHDLYIFKLKTTQSSAWLSSFLIRDGEGGVPKTIYREIDVQA